MEGFGILVILERLGVTLKELENRVAQLERENQRIPALEAELLVCRASAPSKEEQADG